MSDKPQDPARDTVDQQNNTGDHFEGQEGYGVAYEDGQFQNETMRQPQNEVRSGSYETTDIGGYGSTQPTPNPTRPTGDESTLPPDPEAQQGQGGQ